MSDDKILHRAEEHGQSRPLTIAEVGAFTLIAAIKALASGVAAGALIVIARVIMKESPPITPSVWLAIAGVFVVALAVNLWGDLDRLVEGLRSLRFIETFSPVPSQPGPEPVKPWRPPIPVFSRGDVQLVDVNERPALPAPPEQPALTPLAVLEILGASLENQGSFSRRTITRLRLADGRKVTRGMWQEAAAWLHQVGILRRDAQGSYCLPSEIQNFDDLYIQLPGLRRLERAGLGGQRTGPGTGGHPEDRPIGGEGPPVGRQGATLADRRRARWLAERLRSERLTREETK